MVEKLIESIFPKELIDRDSEDTFSSVVAVVKANMLKSFLVENGTIPHTDELMNLTESFDVSELTNVKSFIENTKAAVNNIKEKIAKSGDTNSGY
jgi:hypothetical protein